ncbi:hypothetical protein AbraIFM66950_006983 [Aspergillus brasiliensis]|nr:hypothetical protein AbraIFM66950_006983 [Aspergillus brasiliensis]
MATMIQQSPQEAGYFWRSSSDTWTSSNVWEPPERRCSMDDEEEVLYELDEVALAQLPLHLQHNMRQLQLERMRKLLHNRDPDSRVPSRPVHPNPYAQTWFKNMMARLSADQEMNEVHEWRESVQLDGDPDDTTWRLVPRQRTGSRQHHDRRTWHFDHATSGENDFSAYSTGSTRVCSLHGLGVNEFGFRLSETGSQGGSKDQKQEIGKVSSKPRKRNVSIITHVRAHVRFRVRKSVQKLGKLLRK